MDLAVTRTPHGGLGWEGAEMKRARRTAGWAGEGPK